VTKALLASAMQASSSAKTNPEGLGQAARLLMSTGRQTLQSVSVAASAAEDPKMKEDIIVAARALADSMTTLLNACKGTVANKDSSSIENLNSATNQVSKTIEDLVQSLGGVVSPECGEASRSILNSLQTYDD
jgi:hypothetical protein